MKLRAFTLAEVLITLGVLGIISAITLPTIITNYQKKRVETQLFGFYSKINQAIRLSSVDNGDIEGWITQRNYSYEEHIDFLNQYIFPYMKYLGYEKCYTTSGQLGVCISLIDGGLMWFSVDNNGGDIVYVVDYNEGIAAFRSNTELKNKPHKVFQFQFAKKRYMSSEDIKSTTFVEPYILDWDGSKDGLRRGTWACVKGCTNCGYCAKLIQLNSWKIPGDYPW